MGRERGKWDPLTGRGGVGGREHRLQLSKMIWLKRGVGGNPEDYTQLDSLTVRHHPLTVLRIRQLVHDTTHDVEVDLRIHFLQGLDVLDGKATFGH